MKGKSGKEGGTKGKSKDVGALVWGQQTGRPVASSAASSAPQTETSTTVGTIYTVECTALDLCATTVAQQEIANPRWIAFNVDTGAGGTVWPMNADCAWEKVSGPAGRNDMQILLPPNTEKWLRKLYMITMATVKAMRTSVRRTTASSQTTSGTTRTSCSSPSTTPMTTLTQCTCNGRVAYMH